MFKVKYTGMVGNSIESYLETYMIISVLYLNQIIF